MTINEYCAEVGLRSLPLVNRARTLSRSSQFGRVSLWISLYANSLQGRFAGRRLGFYIYDKVGTEYRFMCFSKSPSLKARRTGLSVEFFTIDLKEQIDFKYEGWTDTCIAYLWDLASRGLFPAEVTAALIEVLIEGVEYFVEVDLFSLGLISSIPRNVKHQRRMFPGLMDDSHCLKGGGGICNSIGCSLRGRITRQPHTAKHLG